MYALLILFAQIPFPESNRVEHVDSRKVVLIVDGGKESRALVSELTRDWSKRSPKLVAYEAIRQRVSKNVMIVRRDWVDRDIDCPFFRYGERGEPEHFPPQTFSGSGCPLLTMEVIIANLTKDYGEWEDYCYRVRLDAEMSHAYQAGQWLSVSCPQEWKAFRCLTAQWGEADNAGFLAVQERFSCYDGYPEYHEPALPPKPVRRYPWEKGYVFPAEIVPPAPPPPSEELIP